MEASKSSRALGFLSPRHHPKHVCNITTRSPKRPHPKTCAKSTPPTRDLLSPAPRRPARCWPRCSRCWRAGRAPRAGWTACTCGGTTGRTAGSTEVTQRYRKWCGGSTTIQGHVLACVQCAPGMHIGKRMQQCPRWCAARGKGAACASLFDGGARPAVVVRHGKLHDARGQHLGKPTGSKVRDHQGGRVAGLQAPQREHIYI